MPIDVRLPVKPLLMLVEAVLFDLDGTLVETNIDFARMRREMIALASQQGVDPADVADLDILAIIDRTAERVALHNGSRAAHDLKIKAWSILEEIEVAHAINAEPMPYSDELLAALSRRDIKVGIVTRNSRKASLMALESLQYRPDILICREDTLRFKPHPEPLHAALKALSVSPQAAIMVGDHLMDIESGKAAGVKTIGLLREHRPENFFERLQPDLVVRSLREVLCAIVGCDS